MQNTVNKITLLYAKVTGVSAVYRDEYKVRTFNRGDYCQYCKITLLYNVHVHTYTKVLGVSAVYRDEYKVKAFNSDDYILSTRLHCCTPRCLEHQLFTGMNIRSDFQQG